MSLYINNVARYTGINISEEAHAFIFRAEDNLPIKKHGVTVQKKLNFASRLATNFVGIFNVYIACYVAHQTFALISFFFWGGGGGIIFFQLHTKKYQYFAFFFHTLSPLLF